MCQRYRHRELQHGTREGSGDGKKFRSRFRNGCADSISGGDAASDVHRGGRWARAMDRSGPCGVGRADISLVGPPARRRPGMTVVAATTTKASIGTLKETTIMNVMTAAILGITAITAIILMIAAAVSAPARAAASESQATQVVPAASPPRVRRRTMRSSGVSRPIALIRPQYLPALARSRILRLRMLRAR